MKRTTVSLPDELAARLEREARRRHQPVSQVVREALAARFEYSTEQPHRYSFIGIGDSGRGDISERFDEYLAEAMEHAVKAHRDPE